MEVNLSAETLKFGRMLSVYVSCAMVGWVTGNGGSGSAAELIYVISVRMKVEHVS